MIGFILFPGVWALCEMQSVSYRIWTRITVSISYDDNHYTTGTSDFDYRLRYSVGAVCRRIVWSSILLGESRQALRLSLFKIFLRTESSSSWVNGFSLMSNCFLIILMLGSCVTFGGFSSRFSKCSFHSFILSCWFLAFSGR